MDLKVAKETMQTLQPGNNSGFSLIEATVSIFIASLTLCSVLAMTRVAVNLANKTMSSMISIMEDRNNAAEIVFSSQK